MSGPFAEHLATARELVTLAIHNDDELPGVVADVVADPPLAAGVLEVLATALAATFSSPEDWQQHLVEADIRAETERGNE